MQSVLGRRYVTVRSLEIYMSSSFYFYAIIQL